MSTIAVISDTHRSTHYSQLTLNALKNLKIDELFHLGDFYEDAQLFIDHGYTVTRIPGTWTPYYQNPMIDNRLIVDVLGWTLGLSHTPDAHYNDLPTDPTPEAMIASGNLDIFMHGHTHHPRIDRHPNGTVLFNPGHLKERDDRGYDPSFGILNITPTQCDITIYRLFDLSEFKKETLTKKETLKNEPH